MHLPVCQDDMNVRYNTCMCWKYKLNLNIQLQCNFLNVLNSSIFTSQKTLKRTLIACINRCIWITGKHQLLHL